MTSTTVASIVELVQQRLADGTYLDHDIVHLVDDPLPPASPAAIGEAERVVGHPMPPLLRKLYGDVANGGFGPGYGLLSLPTTHGPEPHSVIERLGHRNWTRFDVPATLVPLCDWGCAIVSYVDWADGDYRIWGFDPNASGDLNLSIQQQEMGLHTWFELWLAGTLYQPCVGEDDEGTWRCATNDELAEAISDL